MYMYFQQTLGTSSPLLSSRSTRVCVAIARADGRLGSRVSAPDKPLYVSARAPAAIPLTSSADFFAAGKRVLLVDVRTEEEMRVSMLRGAVTRQDITQPYRASERVMNGNLHRRPVFSSSAVRLGLLVSESTYV